MRKQMIVGLAAALTMMWAAQTYATPPRGLMQVSHFGGAHGGDCGCESRGEMVYEESCGCEPSCCEPCCRPCCGLRIISGVVHGAGCLLNEIFTCHRCCDSGCDAGCGTDDYWGCSDCTSCSGYPEMPSGDAPLAPMSMRTSRAYQQWNMSPRGVAAAPRSSKRAIARREPQAEPQETSIVRSKPSTAKKPAKISARTAASARPLSKADAQDSLVKDEDVKVRRTSYSEPAKSRVPHNPLRD